MLVRDELLGLQCPWLRIQGLIYLSAKEVINSRIRGLLSSHRYELILSTF